jgi:type 1 glutamine amidotransferase
VRYYLGRTIVYYCRLRTKQPAIGTRKKRPLPTEEELRAEIETQKEMFYLQHNQNKDICGENTKMTKIEKAQESCEQVLNGIEDGTITTTSALLVILYARPFSREEKVTWKY